MPLHTPNSLLAQRAIDLTPSTTMAMHAQVKALQHRGVEVADLTIGEPEGPTPLPIQKAAEAAIASGKHFGYPPVAGYTGLREAVARKLKRDNGLQLSAEEVMISMGAKHALYNVLMAVLNPGDEVIMYSPYWASYASMVQVAGGKPVPLQGDLAQHFIPTLDQVAETLSGRTKVLLFSSPCNPTGSILDEAYLKGLAGILEQYPRVLVLADEVYEAIYFDRPAPSIGSLSTMRHKTATVGSFSKAFAMPGWRVGYLGAPIWLIQACTNLQSQSTSGVSGIVQKAALAAMRMDEREAYLRDMRSAYARRWEIVEKHLKALPDLQYSTPKGAFFCWMQVKAYLGTACEGYKVHATEDLCHYLLHKAHVAVLPGTSFGAEDYIRISFSVSEKTLRQGMKRLIQALPLLQKNCA